MRESSKEGFQGSSPVRRDIIEFPWMESESGDDGIRMPASQRGDMLPVIRRGAIDDFYFPC